MTDTKATSEQPEINYALLEIGEEIAGSILDNWIDEGHSTATDAMDRGYAAFAIEGRLCGRADGYTQVEIKVLTKVIMAYLEDVFAK